MEKFYADFETYFPNNKKPMTNKIRWECISKEITKHKTNGKYD